MIWKLFRPIFFIFPAEVAHSIGGFFLKILSFLPILKIKYPQSLSQNFFGLKFNSPIGLAAGFDKDAKYLRGLNKLGFEFIEAGTVTPLAQSGNPKPRLFRDPANKALINRMGFNNSGMLEMKKSLMNFQVSRPELVLGINIGKNKTTPNENAVSDYLKCMDELAEFADYFTVNISSPNTEGLRELFSEQHLESFVKAIMKKKKDLNGPPVFLKISPDLENEDLQRVIKTSESFGMDGYIVSNTLKSPEGGISGAPLWEKSTSLVSEIWKLIMEIRNNSQKTSGNPFIIATGGIFNGQDALEKIKHGASLIQVYTGFVYEGPGFVKKLNLELSSELNSQGFATIGEAIGKFHGTEDL